MSDVLTPPARYLPIRALASVPGRLSRTLAFDLQVQREVVVTCFAGSAPEVQRFLVECDLARQLEAPALVRILAAEAHGDGAFLASEVPAAVNLRQVLASSELSLRAVARLFRALCETLAYFHARGLVHGDIDPGNVLVLDDGHVLLDGYLPAPARAQLIQAQAGEVLPRYCPPEWHRLETIVPQADVYSLGVLLHELLTGVALLKSGTLAETHQKQLKLQERLDSQPDLFSYVPAGLRPLLTALVQVDLAKRPPSVHELLPHLQQVFGGLEYKGGQVPELTRVLRYPRLENRSALISSARNALDDGRLMAAATYVRLATACQPVPREVRTLEEMLVECLWRTYLPGQAVEGSVVTFQVFRAAQALKVNPVSILARRRLESFAKGGGPDAMAVATPSHRLDDARLEDVKGFLRAKPDNELMLLTLAVFDEGAHVAEGETLSAFKARLASGYGLPVVALTHAARAFGEVQDPRGPLEALHGYSEAAFQAFDMTSLSSPPGMGGLNTGNFGASLEAFVVDKETNSDVPGSEAPRLSAFEVESLLTECEALLESRLLVDAAKVLERLYQYGAFRVEQHYATICRRIRDLIWLAILPGTSGKGLDEALETVLKVARSIGLHSLVPIAERMLVASIPELERPERVARLLIDSPDSIPILQAASRLAASHGDAEDWGRHLATAGSTFLSAGEMMLASKMFMALRSLDPGSREASQGLERVMELGAAMAKASTEFKDLTKRFPDSSRQPEALNACENFLARYPNHAEALAWAAELNAGQGRATEAARLWMQLAKRALYREEDERARGYLCKVLRNDFDNDEALLYLVTMDPPTQDAPREVWKLKIWLLGREELPEAAIFHARKRLTGGSTDLPILEIILTLTKNVGRDPSPTLLEAGLIAWETGQIDLARRYFDAAYRAAPDKGAFIDQLLDKPGIDTVFPKELLVARKTDPGKALIPD